jgi:signal transduction histidine kinase
VGLALDGGSVEFDTLEGRIQIDARVLAADDMAEEAETWLYLYGSADQPGVYQLVQVNQTALARDQRLASFRHVVLVTAGLTLVLAAGLGFLLIWQMLRPLKAITEAAAAAAGTPARRRLQVRGGDELGDLASTINGMFDRVENAIEAERQAASDLSHELRTPLAVMKTEATRALKKDPGDEAYQRALETVEREVSHVSAVTDRLLYLARSEHAGDIGRERVDLQDLLTEVGWDADVLCEDKGISFESDVSETRQWTGLGIT